MLRLDKYITWDISTFTTPCKCLESTNPKHTYKYFPGQELWMWEKEVPNSTVRTGYWNGADKVHPCDFNKWMPASGQSHPTSYNSSTCVDEQPAHHSVGASRQR